MSRPDAAPRDGVLVVDKPGGPTSHDIVALVRRLFGTKRVGHGGTLDPFARGVLVLFLGSATRVAEYHLRADKSYRATVCIGARSTTDDLDGELTPGEVAAPDRAAFEQALGQFRGPLSQRPPDYSARKVGGRRAYALARAGLTPVLEPRDVVIRHFELTDWDDSDPRRPVAQVDIACTAGTYVRSLARDLGDLLGCGAYLGALTRTSSGSFALGDAHSLDQIRAAAAGDRPALDRLVRPVDAGLESFARLILQPDEVAAIARGQIIRVRARVEGAGQPATANSPAGAEAAGETPARSDGPVLLYDQRRHVVAIGHVADGRLAPDKVLVAQPPPARTHG